MKNFIFHNKNIAYPHDALLVAYLVKSPYKPILFLAANIMNITPVNEASPLITLDDAIFESVVNDLVKQGFSIQPNRLPVAVVDALLTCQRSMKDSEYQKAGIGRATQFQQKDDIRSDEISWITGSTVEGQIWLSWCDALKTYINRSLFMGLFSFESHFACYDVGAFYKRHLDAFKEQRVLKNQTNRVLSLVAYLNEDWKEGDGGELVLYQNNEDTKGLKIEPTRGTFVVFLSEEFPHEVLMSNRERHSVAGWFRVNGSINAQIDPPI